MRSSLLIIATLAAALAFWTCGTKQRILYDGTSDSTGDDTAGEGDVPDDPGVECDRPLCGDDCCTDDETCIGGVCCTEERTCGSVCCAEGELCEALSCHLDCGDDERCGGFGVPEACCAWPEVCYLGECMEPGCACTGDGDCHEGCCPDCPGGVAPVGCYCEPALGRCMPRCPGVECEYMPDPEAFEPVEEWSWTTSSVRPDCTNAMSTPAVANLTDDNGDTVIDENDIPEIVFVTFCGLYTRSEGILRAVSGDGSGELFSIDRPEDYVYSHNELAVGDIDSDGLNEIVTCASQWGPTPGQVLVFENDGTRKWVSDDTRVECYGIAPFIANLDEAGDPEIVIVYTVLDSTGSVVWSHTDEVAHGTRTDTGPWLEGRFSTAADIDLDGDLDVVGGNVVYDGPTGTVIWRRTDLTEGYPAVGNLDGDTGEWADAEIAVVSTDFTTYMSGGGWYTTPHELRVLHSDGTDFWGPVDINPPGLSTPRGPGGGGPPTIADFDGDDRPEIGLAGGYGYVVFNGEDGSLVWFQPTVDLSSRMTGSSVFDFEGDGVAEIVYNDELNVHIYRGTDGTVLWETCNTSGTATEYPVIADVDRDDHAEIIVVANDYHSFTCPDGSQFHGLRVFGDTLGNWVRTRPIWNQHTYHITNVEVDGTIPLDEEPNWLVEAGGVTVFNNFRQNLQASGLHAAPDLVPRDLAARTNLCPETLVLTVRVLNQGSAGVYPGMHVAFYEGDPDGLHTLIAVVDTTRTLLPGMSELFEVEWIVPEERRVDGEVFSIFVKVDDDGTGTSTCLCDCERDELDGDVRECREDNNCSEPLLTECGMIM